MSSHHDSDTLRDAQAKWEPIPPARRREWCRVLLDFPPIWLGTIPMIATQTAVLDGGYTNITDWIELAKRAEAVGFTPQTWLIFRLELDRGFLALEFPNHPEHRPKRRGNGGHETTIVVPEEFAAWPALYAAGHRASAATRQVLSGNAPDLSP
ncbi:mandelate racemase/muconate lactonizing protein [Rhodococcus ruber]|uniref:mandelate racemase/muconate lactonizing protein n=1 Tax=Rhodococcus ruber TaxID=1830 RepID=UPI000F52551B|nr:mandelate racemase/muconate lactonizing protein [Rhodococcus ruber]RQM32246.1 mandelate racemase/muconate lactonizing protein [Rhodococcus ruber]